jgi:hypothetical protein
MDGKEKKNLLIGLLSDMVKMNKAILPVLLCGAIMISGCVERRAPDLNTEAFDFFVGQAIAVMKLENKVGPNRPIPDDDELRRNTPRPVSECDECLDSNGNPVGYVGDGTIRKDCVYCDSNGDGNNADSGYGDSEPEVPAYGERNKQDKIKFIPDKLQLDIVPELVWHTSTAAATAKAAEVDLPILVLLSKDSPSEVWESGMTKLYILNNFVLLKVNLSDLDAKKAWAESAKGSDRFKDGELLDPTLTVLSKEGKFLYDQIKGFQAVPDNSLGLIDVLKSLK